MTSLRSSRDVPLLALPLHSPSPTHSQLLPAPFTAPKTPLPPCPRSFRPSPRRPDFSPPPPSRPSLALLPTPVSSPLPSEPPKTSSVALRGTAVPSALLRRSAPPSRDSPTLSCTARRRRRLRGRRSTPSSSAGTYVHLSPARVRVLRETGRSRRVRDEPVEDRN